MAVQEKILSAVPEYAGTAKKAGVDTALEGKVGILAIGKPGDITSRAFGPVARSGIVATEGGEKFGTYVANKGVVVNSNDVANMANYDENFKAAKGQTVSYLEYGTCLAWTSALAAIEAGMNARVIYGASEAAVSGTGITKATPVWATFAAKVGEKDGVYVFEATVANTTPTWKLDGATVDIAQYGLTASGTVATGDKIIVKFNSLCDIEVTGFKAAAA